MQDLIQKLNDSTGYSGSSISCLFASFCLFSHTKAKVISSSMNNNSSACYISKPLIPKRDNTVKDVDKGNARKIQIQRVFKADDIAQVSSMPACGLGEAV